MLGKVLAAAKAKKLAEEAKSKFLNKCSCLTKSRVFEL